MSAAAAVAPDWMCWSSRRNIRVQSWTLKAPATLRRSGCVCDVCVGARVGYCWWCFAYIACACCPELVWLVVVVAYCFHTSTRPNSRVLLCVRNNARRLLWATIRRRRRQRHHARKYHRDSHNHLTTTTNKHLRAAAITRTTQTQHMTLLCCCCCWSLCYQSPCIFLLFYSRSLLRNQ